MTLLLYPGATAGSFRLHETDDKVTTITAQTAPGGTSVTLSRVLRATILRVRAGSLPLAVKAGATALSLRSSRDAVIGGTSGWYWDSSKLQLWVKIPAARGCHGCFQVRFKRF